MILHISSIKLAPSVAATAVVVPAAFSFVFLGAVRSIIQAWLPQFPQFSVASSR